MVYTAGPTLSVPVRFVLPRRNPSGMAVMAGSASSQHASAPLGATAHLFNLGTETGEGSGVSLTEVGRLVPTGAAAFESDSTTGRCGIASVDHREGTGTP